MIYSEGMSPGMPSSVEAIKPRNCNDSGHSELLYLSLTQIFPVRSGGQIRSASIIKALACRGWKVNVICLTGRKIDYISLKPSESVLIEPSVSQYVNRGIVNGLLQFLCYKLQIPDIWLSVLPLKFTIPSNVKSILEHCNSVVIDTPYSHGFLKLVRNRYTVLISHNCEGERWQNIKFGRVKKVIARLFENRAASKVHAALVTTDEEKKLYSGYKCSNIFVLPNSPLPEFFASKLHSPVSKESLGFGSFDTVLVFPASKYAPNVEAVNFLQKFVNENYSSLKDLSIKILVVGSVHRKLFKCNVLSFLGYVEDVRPYFYAADALLNPVIYGSGSCLKTAEAIAARLPIISTSFGIRGFCIDTRKDAIIFAREYLHPSLNLFCKLSSKVRSDMAISCYKRNAHLLDTNGSLAAANKAGLDL